LFVFSEYIFEFSTDAALKKEKNVTQRKYYFILISAAEVTMTSNSSTFKELGDKIKEL
jgi:hypothetical protein